MQYVLYLISATPPIGLNGIQYIVDIDHNISELVASIFSLEAKIIDTLKFCNRRDTFLYTI